MSIYIGMFMGMKLANPMEIVRMEHATMTATKHENPLVIYHGNCADGFSAAWCFHHAQDKFETEFDFHAGVYNDPPPDVTGKEVYLVDFSYKSEVVEEMLKTAKNIVLIDHHKTAIDDLTAMRERLAPVNFQMYTDLERSGAMLAWDFLHNTVYEEYDLETITPAQAAYTAPPTLLGHVQDRDLWRFKLPLTREIQANVFSYEYTFENWDKLMLETSTLTLAEGGAAIERKHHKDIAELVKICQRVVDIGFYHVPIASLPYTMSSDAAHLMAKNYMSGTLFAACYIDTATHRVFSLRSTENGLDVSAIAKSYGGGGHKNAAGFRVERSHELARI